jgi:hypothetical protein
LIDRVTVVKVLDLVLPNKYYKNIAEWGWTGKNGPKMLKKGALSCYFQLQP